VAGALAPDFSPVPLLAGGQQVADFLTLDEDGDRMPQARFADVSDPSQAAASASVNRAVGAAAG
jgi:hypothetical protein